MFVYLEPGLYLQTRLCSVCACTSELLSLPDRDEEWIWLFVSVLKAALCSGSLCGWTCQCPVPVCVSMGYVLKFEPKEGKVAAVSSSHLVLEFHHGYCDLSLVFRFYSALCSYPYPPSFLSSLLPLFFFFSW